MYREQGDYHSIGIANMARNESNIRSRVSQLPSPRRQPESQTPGNLPSKASDLVNQIVLPRISSSRSNQHPQVPTSLMLR